MSFFPSLISKPKLLAPCNKHRADFPYNPSIFALLAPTLLPAASSGVFSSFELDSDELNEPRLGVTFGFSADAAPLPFSCNPCHYFSDHVAIVIGGASIKGRGLWTEILPAGPHGRHWRPLWRCSWSTADDILKSSVFDLKCSSKMSVYSSFLVTIPATNSCHSSTEYKDGRSFQFQTRFPRCCLLLLGKSSQQKSTASHFRRHVSLRFQQIRDHLG